MGCISIKNIKKPEVDKSTFLLKQDFENSNRKSK